jgi:hypothetical protein
MPKEQVILLLQLPVLIARADMTWMKLTLRTVLMNLKLLEAVRVPRRSGETQKLHRCRELRRLSAHDFSSLCASGR